MHSPFSQERSSNRGQIQPERTTTRAAEPYLWNGLPREVRPIDFYLKEIVSRIADNDVTVVESPTASGKTTRIAQALMQEMPDVPIYMTQTRRPAVRSNSAWIAKEMGVQLGRRVGWRLSREEPMVDLHGEKSQLTLMIDQSIVNRIRDDKRLPDGVLIIDEAHERGIQTDLLLALVRKYLPVSPNTKVVITSATLDTEKFDTFFRYKTSAPASGAPSGERTKELSSLKVAEPVRTEQKRAHAVDIEYVNLGRYEHHSQGAARKTCELIDRWANNALFIPSDDPEKPKVKVNEGVISVLLPGREDINAVMRTIKERCANDPRFAKVTVIPYTGSMTKEEQSLLGMPLQSGELRIVCATEVLRSSITIPNLVACVDSFEVRRRMADHSGINRTVKIPISGSEAIQALGRLGREHQGGLYCPVCSESEYLKLTNRNNPNFWSLPAIIRESPLAITLQVAAAGFSIRDLEMLDKPYDSKIDVAIKKLQRLQLLDEHEQVTELGLKAASIPLDPELAVTLFKAERSNILPEVAVVLAMLEESDDIRFTPTRNTESFILATKDIEKFTKTLLQLKEDETLTEAESARLTKLMKIVGQLGKRKDKLHIEITFTALGDELRKIAREESRSSFKNFDYVSLTNWFGDIWNNYANGTQSDFVALISVYKEFCEVKRNAPSEQALRWWAQSKGLKLRNIEYVHERLKELALSCSKIEGLAFDLQGIISGKKEASGEAISAVIAAGMLDSLYFWKAENSEYHNPKLRQVSTPNTSSAFLDGMPSYVLATSYLNIKQRTVMRYAAPLSLEVLSGLFPDQNIIKRQEGEAYYDGWLRRVVVRVPVRIAFPESGTNKSFLAGYVLEDATREVAAKKLAECITTYSMLYHSEWQKYLDLQRKVADCLQKFGLDPAVFQRRFTIFFAQKILDKFPTLEEMTPENLLNMPLLPTDEDVSKLLGLNFAQLVEDVERLFPTSFLLHGEKVPILYDTYDGGSTKASGEKLPEDQIGVIPPQIQTYQFARITLSLEQLKNFSWSDFPETGARDVSLRVSFNNVTEQVYRSNPDSLEEIRLRIAGLDEGSYWGKFVKAQDLEGSDPDQLMPMYIANGDIQVFSLPEPKIWYPTKNKYAYPAYQMLHNTSVASGYKKIILNWHQSEQDAEQGQAKFLREVDLYRRGLLRLPRNDTPSEQPSQNGVVAVVKNALVGQPEVVSQFPSTEGSQSKQTLKQATYNDFDSYRVFRRHLSSSESELMNIVQNRKSDIRDRNVAISALTQRLHAFPELMEAQKSPNGPVISYEDLENVKKFLVKRQMLDFDQSSDVLAAKVFFENAEVALAVFALCQQAWNDPDAEEAHLVIKLYTATKDDAKDLLEKLAVKIRPLINSLNIKQKELVPKATMEQWFSELIV